VAAIEKLYTELGYSDELSEQSRRWAADGVTALGRLDAEDEELIVGLRCALARLASAAELGEGDGGMPEMAVIAALDGVELVMRGEILLGNDARLPLLMPSFAFLTTLPVAGKVRALALSRRVEELLEAGAD
jgi:hypothetical protein